MNSLDPEGCLQREAGAVELEKLWVRVDNFGVGCWDTGGSYRLIAKFWMNVPGG